MAAAGWPARVTLLPSREKIASALNVWRGSVIVTTGGYIGDAPPYQGHVVVIRRASGRIAAVFNSLCSGTRRLLAPAACPQSDSAIWGRAGAVVDPATGDDPGRDRQRAVRRPHGVGRLGAGARPGCAIAAHSYTPANQAELNATDLDLGSSAPALVASRGLVVAQGGKDGVLRLVALAGRAPGGLGGELQQLPTPGGAPLFTAIAVCADGGRRSGCSSPTASAPPPTGCAERARATRLVAGLGERERRHEPGRGRRAALRLRPGRRAQRLRPGAADAACGRCPPAPATGRRRSSPTGVVALPVGDANDHSTTGAIDLYAR